jgi:anti-sigma B factor antagonist
MDDEFDDSFELEERPDGDTTVVALHGELDLGSVETVRACLDALRTQGRGVVLDLDGLTFMDSTGIRVVLEAVQHSEEEGWAFTITRGSPAVRRIFGSAQIADRLPYCSPRGG